MKISRRNLLARLAFYGSPVAAFGYGSLIERHWLDITRTDIPLASRYNHLDGLKIAVMGDFHFDDWGSRSLIASAVKVVNEEPVDAVILVGDYISDQVGAMEPLCEELSHLRPRFGTFGVMGNHDCWHFDLAIPNLLEKAGVQLLRNRAIDCGEFAIAGLDSYWGGSPDIEFTVKDLDPEKPILSGWHEPDTFDYYKDPRTVLQVSGHTHGGQVRAPFYGPLLLPEFGRKYPYGHYRNENSSLFVTRGIGTLNLPVRFLCPPELAILTMRRDKTA
ncbi:MAG: metallophosphoesterase [Verrucomicrobiales bacterium]|nr:metallophosphoesterase [Verrucomicrobiales bacterium]